MMNESIDVKDGWVEVEDGISYLYKDNGEQVITLDLKELEKVYRAAQKTNDSIHSFQS